MKYDYDALVWLNEKIAETAPEVREFRNNMVDEGYGALDYLTNVGIGVGSGLVRGATEGVPRLAVSALSGAAQSALNIGGALLVAPAYAANKTIGTDFHPFRAANRAANWVADKARPYSFADMKFEGGQGWDDIAGDGTRLGAAIGMAGLVNDEAAQFVGGSAIPVGPLMSGAGKAISAAGHMTRGGAALGRITSNPLNYIAKKVTSTAQKVTPTAQKATPTAQKATQAELPELRLDYPGLNSEDLIVARRALQKQQNFEAALSHAAELNTKTNHGLARSIAGGAWNKLQNLPGNIQNAENRFLDAYRAGLGKLSGKVGKELSGLSDATGLFGDDVGLGAVGLGNAFELGGLALTGQGRWATPFGARLGVGLQADSEAAARRAKGEDVHRGDIWAEAFPNLDRMAKVISNWDVYKRWFGDKAKAVKSEMERRLAEKQQ